MGIRLLNLLAVLGAACAFPFGGFEKKQEGVGVWREDDPPVTAQECVRAHGHHQMSRALPFYSPGKAHAPYFPRSPFALSFNSVSPTSLDPDMSKLNEYLQAEKENSINAESIYGDLQNRFEAVKRQYMQQETERLAMRKALRAAQTNAKTYAVARNFCPIPP